ncbi:helicase HerA domain-containing protein [Paracoccus methylovorus]|uniref:helicase HerA domain-containing protein n=1 Tax=Paracoccus methylovorus TaxID=2812658 RepID=UPI001F0531BF|nr:DUF87 domain-containing protein [Paracoccus methylovorus]
MNVLSDERRFPSARIVVLDLHGEYGKALGDRANIFKISPDARNANEHRLCIPFWALSFDELMRVTFGSLPPDGKARNIILEQILEAKIASLTAQPIAGVDSASITADSPVPFSLNKLWHDLYCREFGTYLSAGGANPSDQATWAYECDPLGAKIVGDAHAAVPPRFRKVKNVAADPEKINWLPDVLNIRGPLEALGARLRVARYDFLLKAGDWHPELDGTTTKTLADLVGQWLGSDKPITILDLSGIPSTVTNDIIGNILRVLYDGLFWARNLSEGGRERPLLVVMEEAHSYLGDNGSSAGCLLPRQNGRQRPLLNNAACIRQ